MAKWSLLATLIYVAFNLVIAVGLRDMLGRLLARKRIRELVFFFVILAVALPQLLLARQGMISPQLRLLVTRDAWQGWPWTATSNLILGNRFWPSLAVLSAWTVGTLVFSRWQFSRTLAFDSDAANAGDSEASRRSWWIEWFYRLPSARIQRSAGRPDRKGISLPGALAALSSGVPDGIHIWPGDLAADGVRSAGAAGRIFRAQLSHGGLRVLADADE